MRSLVAVAACLLAAGCGLLGYGDLLDRSQFVSAALTREGDGVLFTFHRFAYRPAEGIRAFPDGGVPRYVSDRHLIGLYRIGTGELRILRDEANEEWSHGSGRIRILQARGDVFLLSQGGQTSRSVHDGTYETSVRHFLVRLPEGEVETLFLEKDLADRGRALGHIHLVDRKGTLVLVSPSLEERERDIHWSRNPDIVPEIWVRVPDGGFILAGASRFYEGFDEGRLYWWNPDDGLYREFSAAGRRIRLVSRWERPPHPSPETGARVGDQGSSLQLGRRGEGGWVYEPLGLSVGDLP